MPRPVAHFDRKVARWSFILVAVWIAFYDVRSQGKLEITGQKNLSTTEGQSITLKLTDFTVKGSGEGQYPKDFRLEVFDGNNYSASGTTVTPDDEFTGILKVEIKISRLKNGVVKAESDRTDISVEVKENTTPPSTPAKLTITDQVDLSTTGTTPLMLELSHFTIGGPGDDEYPMDFRLEVYDDDNYDVDGTSIIPDAGFTGTLDVVIKISRVKGGKVIAETDKTKIQVQVKAPGSKPAKLTITSQKTLETTGTTPLTLQLSDFTIDGPGEDEYPNGFKLDVFSGNDYSVSGTTVTADDNFKGPLTVTIQITRVKNGKVIAESDRKGIVIEVKQSSAQPNTPPQIIGQKTIRIFVNQSVTIGFSHLTVVDPDDKYPEGFKLKLSNGANYTITSGVTVVPAADFKGTLTVKSVVNDGKADSQPFDLKITVTEEDLQPAPITGPPVFVTFSQGPLSYSLGDDQFFIASEITIDDPDSEDLFYAEIFFDSLSFVPGKDELIVEPTGALSAVYDPTAGLLVIFGRENLASYQQTLQSIRYIFTNDTLPAEKRKVIHFRMNDGENFSAIKSKIIEMDELLLLDIPNVFSPNDDAKNDFWKIQPQREPTDVTAVVRVFDQRGNLLFETNDLEDHWDGRSNGKPVPADSYFYTIEVQSGTQRIRQQGIVTLLK